MTPQADKRTRQLEADRLELIILTNEILSLLDQPSYVLNECRLMEGVGRGTLHDIRRRHAAIRQRVINEKGDPAACHQREIGDQSP